MRDRPGSRRAFLAIALPAVLLVVAWSVPERALGQASPEPEATASPSPEPEATPSASPSPSPSPTPGELTPAPNPSPTPTGGPEGTTDPTIVAAGDIACGAGSPFFRKGFGRKDQCRQWRTSQLAVAGAYTAVLTLGDNQYDRGAYHQFLHSYDLSWGRLLATTHPSVGNHEYETRGAAGYFEYFGAAAGALGQGYYSFDVGAWHLIALNSNCWAVSCAKGSAQQRWLKADLAAHPAECTLAYWHHPLYSSGYHGHNTDVRPLFRTLYRDGADVVLNGHDHDYERFAPLTPAGRVNRARGIREFVVGTGGKQHYPLKPHLLPASESANDTTFGVLQLTLHPHGYSWSFIPVAGKTFTDHGDDTCH